MRIRFSSSSRSFSSRISKAIFVSVECPPGAGADSDLTAAGTVTLAAGTGACLESLNEFHWLIVLSTVHIMPSPTKTDTGNSLLNILIFQEVQKNNNEECMTLKLLQMNCE